MAILLQPRLPTLTSQHHLQSYNLCQQLTLQRLLGADCKDPIVVEPAPIPVWSKDPGETCEISKCKNHHMLSFLAMQETCPHILVITWLFPQAAQCCDEGNQIPKKEAALVQIKRSLQVLDERNQEASHRKQELTRKRSVG